jgi:hypothetical protein
LAERRKQGRAATRPSAAVRRTAISLPAVLALVLFTGSLLLSGCLPDANTRTPMPSDTPAPPTATTTPTIVWFPATRTPTPFLTPVITPTLEASSLVGELLLREDFSSGEAWPLARTAGSSIALGVNELTLALSTPRGYLYALRKEPLLDDFYMEVTASPAICRGEDEYGLLLRVSPGLEFYRFSLSCNGQIRLDKYFQGRASSPQPWIYSGQVPPGAPSQSRLGVAARGREMVFFINGEQQFTLSDPSLASGAIGFFIRAAGEEAMTISFSNLEIYSTSE